MFENTEHNTGSSSKKLQRSLASYYNIFEDFNILSDLEV